ncbi:glycosyltransferase family 9 protein [Vibrio tapetis subsp. quintayensis]|uniref:glycosyltransferase family 9 protein n=1 Tax=Vibrio tapetis TaxID=52443 RepID=UPI0025B30781|nr:glycosyltransferase family 9 protein [Vibrio tapetis]MDN3679509.1 glycosyltransferase family 9 protein [Vibrio tapetis subsp. quintayensis]
MTPLFNESPSALCILRLSAIGDVCNTVAAVQAIQRQWPETKITWITGKLEAKLIGSLPNIEVIVFDKKQGLKGYQVLWKTLKNHRFDALLHMQYAFRASIATLGINARYKLGFDAQRSQDFQHLFTNVKVPSPKAPHVLDGLLAFAKTLGVRDITLKWAIPYSDQESHWALENLQAQSANLVIVPAASKGYKNWTCEGYVALIEHAQDAGWNVILAGSPAKIELELAEAIQCKLAKPVNNLVGKSSLLEMLALLDKAHLVVAPDTGPAHMANAMNTPVIGLYAHHNPERTGPYQYQNYVVSAYEEAIQAATGKPSNKLAWRTRVKDKSAMHRISADRVIRMFDKAVADFSL